MATENRLIYAKDARRAVLKECPHLAYAIDTIKSVDAVPLPCKIGEKVFCILPFKNEIVEDVVEDYDIWSIKNGIKLRISLLNYNSYVIAEFGKTVFLTREEAEAALAKMDGDGNA